MDIINYINKDIQQFKEGTVDAEIITYEISKEDMDRLVESQSMFDTSRIFLLSNDSGKTVEMLMDKPDSNRLVMGNEMLGRNYLQQYIVKKGFDDLIRILQERR